jgi:hypothetical protein
MFRVILFVLLGVFAACSSTPTTLKPTDPLVALAMSSSSSKREITTLERMGLAPKWEHAQRVRLNSSAKADATNDPAKIPIDGLDYVLVLTKNVNYQLHYAFKGTELVSSRLFVIEVNTKDLQQLAIYDLLARRADRIAVNPATKEFVSLDSFESGYGSEFSDSLTKQAFTPGPCHAPTYIPDPKQLRINTARCPDPGKPIPTSPEPKEPKEPQPIPPTCVLPESLKLAITAAEASVQAAAETLGDAREGIGEAEKNLALTVVGSTGAVSSLFGTAGAASPACATIAGCAVTGGALLGAGIAAIVGIEYIKLARRGVERAKNAAFTAEKSLNGARVALKSAQSAAAEWKKSNCK